MQNKLFDMLMKEDEITWQTIIYDLVKSEQMDPWDIDVSLLSQKYLDAVKKLKEMNFVISGKVILASAVLLRIKSYRLVDEDLVRFEELINPPEEFDGELFSDVDIQSIEDNRVVIIPKTPQPRRRKVGVDDLVSALVNQADDTDVAIYTWSSAPTTGIINFQYSYYCIDEAGGLSVEGIIGFVSGNILILGGLVLGFFLLKRRR